jgi:hypothetical protein
MYWLVIGMLMNVSCEIADIASTSNGNLHVTSMNLLQTSIISSIIERLLLIVCYTVIEMCKELSKLAITMIRIRAVRTKVILGRRVSPVGDNTLVVEDEDCNRDVHHSVVIESHFVLDKSLERSINKNNSWSSAQ